MAICTDHIRRYMETSCVGKGKSYHRLRLVSFSIPRAMLQVSLLCGIRRGSIGGRGYGMSQEAIIVIREKAVSFREVVGRHHFLRGL